MYFWDKVSDIWLSLIRLIGIFCRNISSLFSSKGIDEIKWAKPVFGMWVEFLNKKNSVLSVYHKFPQLLKLTVRLQMIESLKTNLGLMKTLMIILNLSHFSISDSFPERKTSSGLLIYDNEPNWKYAHWTLFKLINKFISEHLIKILTFFHRKSNDINVDDEKDSLEKLTFTYHQAERIHGHELSGRWSEFIEKFQKNLQKSSSGHLLAEVAPKQSKLTIIKTNFNHWDHLFTV